MCTILSINYMHKMQSKIDISWKISIITVRTCDDAYTIIFSYLSLQINGLKSFHSKRKKYFVKRVAK